MTYISRTISFLVYVSLSTTSFAGVFLTQGELDRSTFFAQDSRFQSVGAIHFLNGSTRERGASGVLISPDWVLASAHQVDANTFGGSFGFSITKDYQDIGVYRGVSQVIVHPGWTGGTRGSQLGGVDFALFKLDKPILEFPYVERFRGSDALGTQYFMAGFGMNGLIGQSLSRDSLLRAGSNIGESFGAQSGINLVAYTLLGDSFDDVDLEWNGAPGDSGGGWFQNVNGQFQLAGISSYASFHPTSFAFTGATRVSMFNDWIDSSITAVPEPTSFALVLGCAGSVIVFRRRLKKMLDRIGGPSAS